MNNVLGTPWDFVNEYVSPNGKIVLEYERVGEIAMGSPLSGDCFLKINREKIKLNGMFGGPVVWNENSKKAAIPYWTRNRSQKLAIIDVNRMKIMISHKDFRVIELSKFENGLIYGIDSPIYHAKKIEFDVETEQYSHTMEIKTHYNKDI